MSLKELHLCLNVSSIYLNILVQGGSMPKKSSENVCSIIFQDSRVGCVCVCGGGGTFSMTGI